MQDDPPVPARPPDAEDSAQETTILPDALPGKIGGCEILRVLGEGGMGIVYLARQEKFDRLIAVKVTKGLDPAGRARFWREARLAGALSHPNIVQVFDVGEDGPTMYLMMEYVEGVTLQEKIRSDGPIREAVAVAIVAQVAQALQFAHEKGVIHRDVKPGNILLNRQGLPKLADLGLARHLYVQEGTTLTASGVVLGSVAYMSPEQVADPRKADARSDVYSLGATLYHALTAPAPFPSDSIVSMAVLHANEPRPDPRAVVPAISEKTVEAYRRMMAIDPEARFASMAEVVEALGAPAGFATTASARVRLPLPLRRRTGLRIAAGALAGVVFFSCGWFALRDTTPKRGPLPATKGSVERLADGRLRFRYDFQDAGQLADWELVLDAEGKTGKATVREGSLEVSEGKPAVVRFRHALRVEKIRVKATCLAGEWTPHVNVYLNTHWEGNWEGNWGVACILRGDGMMFCVDGKTVEEGLVPPLQTDQSIEQEIALSEDGRLVWSVDGRVAHQAYAPRVAGRSGSVLLGAYEATTRFELVEIVGVPEDEGNGK